MIALMVALLTAGSTFAAVFPLVTSQAPKVAQLMGKQPVVQVGVGKVCRRITLIKAPPRGVVVQGCSSARKRPCPRRRWW